MKKIIFALFLAILTIVPPVFAYDTGRTDAGPLQRVGKAEVRGLLNVIGLPIELVRTPVDEYKRTPWLATFTFIPRTLTNIFTRAVSAAYDVGLAPFILPFTNDMTPLTEPMGLPDYPWQVTSD